MAITFSEIPKDLLDPGGYIEFDPSLAGSLTDQSSVLLVGHKLATGTAALSEISAITSAGQAAVLFGQDSMLYDCCVYAIKVNQGCAIFASAVAETASNDVWPASTAINLKPLIVNMADDRYEYINLPYYSAVNIKDITDELKRRWHALTARSARAFIALPKNYTDSVALSATLNSSHLNLIPIGTDTAEPAHIWGTVITCVMADHLSNNPSAPETDKELPYITPPAVEFKSAERNLMNHNGLGTWANNSDTVQIKYLVTTYQKNAQGENDSANRDIQVPETLGKWRRIQIYEVMKVYAGYNIAKDASLYGAGQKILDPEELAGFLETLYLSKGMRDYGWFQDLENYSSTLIVEVDPDNDDRFNFVDQPSLIGQFRILAGKSRFITQ